MADNLNLAQILSGISALTTVEDLDVVLKAVEEQKKVFTEKKKIRRSFTSEQRVALAQGNPEAEIIKIEELFDFKLVLDRDLPMAKKWFKAQKPAANHTNPELAAAYYMWRVWNDPKYANYKGNAIIVKQTGLSPVAEDDAEDNDEDEDEPVVDDKEKVRRVLEALRLVVKDVGWNID